MVTTDHTTRRQAIRAMLVEGVTQCGGQAVTGKECHRVHGTNIPSFDGKHTIPVRFEKGALIHGELVFLCSMCAIFAKKAGVTPEPLDVLERRVLEMLGEGQPAPVTTPPVIAPAATIIEAPPAPVMPTVGRVPLVRKDAQPQPVMVRPQPSQPRGPHPRSKQAHANTLRAATSFDAAFTLKGGGVCSCGACDERAGNGFVTKNGDYLGQRFPICGVAVKESIDFATEIRSAGRKPPILIFRDQADWDRFHKNREQEAERRSERGYAVLDGDVIADRKNVCGVRKCNAPKPTFKVARIENGKVLETAICKDCANAARALITELREAGEPWAVHILREGETLSGKAADMLEKGARRVQERRDLRDAQSRQKQVAPHGALATIGDRVKASRQKPKAPKPKAAAPAHAPASFAGKIERVAKEIADKQAAASAPQPEPSTEEPAAAPEIVPVPEQESSTPAPQEGPMGGGNG